MGVNVKSLCVKHIVCEKDRLAVYRRMGAVSASEQRRATTWSTEKDPLSN